MTSGIPRPSLQLRASRRKSARELSQLPSSFPVTRTLFGSWPATVSFQSGCALVTRQLPPTRTVRVSPSGEASARAASGEEADVMEQGKCEGRRQLRQTHFSFVDGLIPAEPRDRRPEPPCSGHFFRVIKCNSAAHCSLHAL